MASFDLRIVILLLINILKSFLGKPSNWDAFDTIGHLTWLKLSLLAASFLLFSFTSIKVPMFNSANTEYIHIHIQIGDLSLLFSVSFLACVLLPQIQYWIACAILILLSFLSTWVFNFFTRFQDFFSTITVLNILVSATLVGDGNQEMRGENQETELEA